MLYESHDVQTHTVYPGHVSRIVHTYPEDSAVILKCQIRYGQRKRKLFHILRLHSLIRQHQYGQYNSAVVAGKALYTPFVIRQYLIQSLQGAVQILHRNTHFLSKQAGAKTLEAQSCLVPVFPLMLCRFVWIPESVPTYLLDFGLHEVKLLLRAINGESNSQGSLLQMTASFVKKPDQAAIQEAYKVGFQLIQLLKRLRTFVQTVEGKHHVPHGFLFEDLQRGFTRDSQSSFRTHEKPRVQRIGFYNPAVRQSHFQGYYLVTHRTVLSYTYTCRAAGGNVSAYSGRQSAAGIGANLVSSGIQIINQAFPFHSRFYPDVFIIRVELDDLVHVAHIKDNAAIQR